MGEKYQALVVRLKEIRNVDRAAAVLHWDQQVNMPRGGARGRAAQLATLSKIAHEMLISDETARLIADAETEVGSADYDSVEASMLRVAKRDFRKSTCVPSSLVAELAEAETLAHEVWAEARAQDHFGKFLPALQRILDLKRREAEFRGYSEHPYDAFLDDYEPGMTASRVKKLFDAHKGALVSLVAAIKERGDGVSDALLRQTYDIDKQRAFGEQMVRAYGYDFERGRQDVAVHPFCITFSQGDVRITTRYNSDYLNPALFGTMHESGHAMYEQGVDPALEGTPLSRGTSLGVHESQSRLWENFVGRSRPFWTWAYPQLQSTFPDQLGGVDLETFYRAINRVAPSFVRVEADEATYNLHIMVRFEIELDLVTGAVPLEKVPQLWNEKFESYLGIVPPSNKLGVLQDVHWSSGLIGYFPTYAIGNLLTAQFYRQALAAHPSIPDEIAQGKFDTLREWMRVNIYQHGRKFTADELTQRLTGEPVECSYFITYLQEKYRDIYG
ncbi:MAG: carboxypeptidase M32 [Anaerolineae bacterium]|nr:carboxypeptidase M32 [Anaerolineae bacterium]NUQ03652.1 carboxypeptidase M32 [Anaerolineae bacterium]